MTDALLIQPSLALDPNMVALARLPERISALDARPVLLCDIDAVAPAALPYLAEQLNIVGPLWRYLPDDAARRAAIKGAVAWHRAKGTPWSITAAVGWAGITAVPDERGGFGGRWAEYELLVPSHLSPTQIETAVALAEFSAPARAHLVRIYNEIGDVRPIVLDQGQALDVGMLDDDSGVYLEGGGVKVAFGSTTGGRLPAPSLLAGIWSGTANRTGRLAYDDRMLLDTWRLDSEVLVDAYGGLGAVFSGRSTAPALGGGGPPARGEIRSGASTWAAAAAAGGRTDTAGSAAPVPVDPPRPWGGPWGGAWRTSISYRSTTET